MREMSTARGYYWFAGNLLGVVFTACLTVSNKDLLNRFGFLSGAGTLLFLHRSASFVFSRLTDTCGSSASSAKFAPRVPLSMLAVACVTSNVSIVLSFFVLREASVAFHQVTPVRTGLSQPAAPRAWRGCAVKYTQYALEDQCSQDGDPLLDELDTSDAHPKRAT